jgi:hypothetical protein
MVVAKRRDESRGMQKRDESDRSGEPRVKRRRDMRGRKCERYDIDENRGTARSRPAQWTVHGYLWVHTSDRASFNLILVCPLFLSTTSEMVREID